MDQNNQNQMPPAPQPVPQTVQPLETAQQQTTLPIPNSPNPNTAPVPPKPMPPVSPNKGLNLKLIVGALVIVLVIGILVAVLLVFLPKKNTDTSVVPQGTEGPGPRDHTSQEFPNFAGIDLGDKTVAFNKVDDSFQLKYLGKIFHEQDTGTFAPREVDFEASDNFTWYGLVNPPDKTLGDGSIFSFKAPLTYQSFVFIMRWDQPEGEHYYMYRVHDNEVSLLREFTKDTLFYAPIIDGFSLGGNFVSIKLFTCPTCTDENPEVLLYHIKSGETKNLGRVSYFAWGKDDASYEYKEYKEGVDESTVPVRKNEFFVESVDILDPK